MQLRDLGRDSVTRRTLGAGKDILVKEVEGGGLVKYWDGISVSWDAEEWNDLIPRSRYEMLWR
jgi:hypothetical protein